MRLSVSMEVVGIVGISLTELKSDFDKCNCYGSRVESQVRTSAVISSIMEKRRVLLN